MDLACIQMQDHATFFNDVSTISYIEGNERLALECMVFFIPILSVLN